MAAAGSGIKRRWASRWMFMAGLLALAVSVFAFPHALTDFATERFFLPTDTTRPAVYSVKTNRDVAMQTRDGVTLRADVHAPIGLVKAPTILTRIPFTDTLWNRLRSDSIARFWAKRGYVVVVQGTRGRYRSEGGFTPMLHEREDGIDTLAWLAAQPWWDGRLAMWGGSAFGQTQWAIADQAEPGPRAFAIQIASTRFQDFFHPGGAFALESALYWTLNSAGPRDQEVDLAALDRGVRALPVSRADDIARADVGFFNDWLANSPGAPYWNAIDGQNRTEVAQAPALLLAGWYDPFLPGMLADFAALSQSPNARDTRLIIGPFAHARDIAWPGQAKAVPYRKSSVEPVLDWFDRALGVQSSATQPRVRIYVMGANVWRDEQEWPLARTKFTPFYLRADGGLSTLPSADGEAADSFVYDPANPAPTRGGAMLGPRAGIAVQDQPGTRTDVLSYVTAPIEAPMEITGPLRARLWVTTEAPSTDFTAKLSFVNPAGIAYNLADGILRRSYSPGERTEIEIDLGATSVLLPAGARLRLDISSSNFPRFDRNPNTGESAVTATRFAPAQQTIWRGGETGAHVLLPVVPD